MYLPTCSLVCCIEVASLLLCSDTALIAVYTPTSSRGCLPVIIKHDSYCSIPAWLSAPSVDFNLNTPQWSGYPLTELLLKMVEVTSHLCSWVCIQLNRVSPVSLYFLRALPYSEFHWRAESFDNHEGSYHSFRRVQTSHRAFASGQSSQVPNNL